MLDPTGIEFVEVDVSADLRERVVCDCLGDAGVFLSCYDYGRSRLGGARELLSKCWKERRTDNGHIMVVTYRRLGQAGTGPGIQGQIHTIIHRIYTHNVTLYSDS
jgi:hypothetical protein